MAAVQDPPDTAGVVVHEQAVGEGAADVLEERQDLGVGQRLPDRERDLELAEAQVVGDADTFDDVGRREADDARPSGATRASRAISSPKTSMTRRNRAVSTA